MVLWYFTNMEEVRRGLLDLQKEKIEQLKEAIQNVRVDKLVASMQEINKSLLDKLYEEDGNDNFKLRLVETIRKNYEFLVKVADVPFNLPILNDPVKQAPIQAISWIDVEPEKDNVN